MFFADRVVPKYIVHSYTLEGCSTYYTQYIYSSVFAASFLPFFLTFSVYGAFLKYGSTDLYEFPSNVALTVGMRENVSCVQTTGPMPTSIEWYNPQGQLVSKDGGDAVNQPAVGGDRLANLTFQSYQRSQGGKYECRVAGPGNNTESLAVCIGEC